MSNTYTTTIRVHDPREPNNPITIERDIIASEPDAVMKTAAATARADGYVVREVLSATVREADHIDTMTRHYVVCAIWSSLGDDGEPLDDVCDPDDLSPGAWAKARGDCADFAMQARHLLADLPLSYGAHPDAGSVWAAAGHDFWLTRNGHGAGFWDRGLDDVGDQLTRIAEGYGEAYAYIGGDAMIHFG